MQSGCFRTMKEVWAFCLTRAVRYDTKLQKNITKPEDVVRQLRLMHFILNAQDSTPVCIRRTLVVARINWPTGMDDCACQNFRISVLPMCLFKTRSLKFLHAWPGPPAFSLANYQPTGTCHDNSRASSACKKEFILEISYYFRQNVYVFCLSVVGISLLKYSSLRERCIVTYACSPVIFCPRCIC